MYSNMVICQICLRTDRKLKAVDTRLSDFHDELCEYGMSCNVDPQYCTTCEHLLRKAYNFKHKCRTANNILNNYRKSKTPINLLHTLLPAPTLGTWEEGNAHVYNYIVTSNNKPQPTLIINKEQSILPKPDNQSEHRTDHLSVPSVFPKEEEEIVLPNSSNNDNIIETKDPLISEDEIKTENVVDDLERNIKIHNKLDDFKSNIKIHTNLEENATANILLEDLENNIKTEIMSDDSEDLVNSVDVSYDSSLNSADDCDSDDFILNDKVYKRRKKMKEEETMPKKKAKNKNDILEKSDGSMKKSLLELTNISISDEEFTNSDSKKKNKDESSTTTKEVDKRKITTLRKKNKKPMNLKDIKDYATETVNKFFEGIYKKQWKVYSKERFRALLNSKFESCEELKTEDGTVIDKQCILQLFDHKSVQSLLKELWKEMRTTTRNSTLTPKTLSLLKIIQNKDNEYKSVFDIKYLYTKEQMMEEFLKRTSYSNYVSAAFKCDMCHQGFRNKKSLQYHMRYHDVKAGEFVCCICKHRTTKKLYLAGHMRTHKIVYKCKLCPLITSYRTSMLNHYNQHQGVEYKCEHCVTTYRSKSAYMAHKTYRCKYNRHFVCTRCASTFTGEAGLRQHHALKHRDAPPIDPTVSETCFLCDVTFVTREVFEKHLKISHASSMKDPIRQVTKRKWHKTSYTRFTCRVCNAKGNSYGWLTLHFELKHPDVDMALLYMDKAKHLCDICGKGFATVFTLRDHLNSHTGARPYACDQCPARFTTRLSVAVHKQVHAPPQRPCHICGKKFRSKGNLYCHMRSHIGDRRFKCPICGKGFLHRGSVKEHVRGVHDNVKRVKKRHLARDTKGCKEEVDND